MAKYNKGEFIIVPNKSQIKGLEPTLQVLFMWLCDHSNDNMQSFPSRRLLAEECGISVRTLDRGIQTLVEMGFIVKSARVEANKQTSNLYEVVMVAQGGADLSPGGANPAPGGATKTAHRTHPLLTQSNNPIEAGGVDNSIKALVGEYEDLQPELTAFTEMRQAIHKPLTLHALKLVIGKLQTLYPGQTQMQRQSLEQSILNGWPGVYELGDKSKTGSTAPADPLAARRLLHPEKYGRTE